ncbi:hypothetical protein [Streptomyces sp. NPDC013181]|uniref:hypothetical protein n=1 Tax=unclassified Streptomyces TaxID=2593676 RepID=UPI0036949D25
MSAKPLESVDRALAQVEAVTAFGIALTSLEYLMRPDTLSDKGLQSWLVERTRTKKSSRRRADILNVVFRPPGIQVIFAGRLLAASVLMNPRSSQQQRTVAVLFITATTYLLQYRIRYGADGTDHMTLVAYSALAAARLAPNDKVVKEAAAWFLTGQTMLSYLAAGLAKGAGVPWRTGMAMPGIFRTRVYGDKRVYDVMKSRPRLSKAMSWGVIIGESVIPLALIAPKKTSWALMGLAGSFHGANALFMGLNRFVWAFVGNYPAVVHCAKNLSLDDYSLRELGRLLPKKES